MADPDDFGAGVFDAEHPDPAADHRTTTDWVGQTLVVYCGDGWEVFVDEC